MSKATTVEVVYPGPEKEVYLPDAHLTARRGETVRLPAQIAESLLAQGWKPAGKPAAKEA